MDDLSGKVAFVAGGYGGIGQAICRTLAGSGATVIVAGRDRDKAERLTSTLTESGAAKAFSIIFDAGKPDQIEAALNETVRLAGPPDILVNSLGLQREQKILDVTAASLEEVLSVNVTAAILLGRAAARTQIENGRAGRHIHLLSIRAFSGLRGRGYSAFCAAKGALAMVVRQHAAELGPYGISVNGVAPGVVCTTRMMARTNEEQLAKLTEQVPLGRLAQPVDIAGPVAFLCSPAASFINGQILNVDGGVSAVQ